MNILKEICQKKIYEINKLKTTINYKNKIVISKRRDFLKKLIEEKKNKFNLIAEIKKSSPSKGEICKKFNLNQIAQDYENAGASCLSILTEKNYFQGDINYISRVKKIIDIPILRKDFILDEFQIVESKSLGADVILLIASVLSKQEIFKLSKLANELHLEVLAEIHNENELEKVMNPYIDLIGVNNRDLKIFKTDINISKKISKKIPSDFLKISESGIDNYNTVKDLRKYGFNGFLIGEYFMKTINPGLAASEFIKKIEV